MTGVSTLGQALTQIERIKVQQNSLRVLSTQLSTGKIGQNFAALKSNVMTSQGARSDIQALDTYINNAKNGDIRMNVMLQTISEFKAQAENFATSIVTFSQEGAHQKGEPVYSDTDPDTVIGRTSGESDIDFTIMQDLAGNIFDLLTDLVNRKDGDRYVLGGADALTRPYGDTSLLESSITGLLEDWKADNVLSPTHIDTEGLIQAITQKDTSVQARALTDNIVGYSDALSAGNVGDIFVRADENAEIKYTALANEDPFRDVLVGLAVLKNATLPPIIDAYTPPNEPPAAPDVQGAPGANAQEMQDNFYALFNAVGSMIENAINDVDEITFRIEAARARVDDFQQNHLESKNILLNTVAEVENVDINEVAVRLSNLQIQIEASYAVTAQTQSLSLVNYLS